MRRCRPATGGRTSSQPGVLAYHFPAWAFDSAPAWHYVVFMTGVRRALGRITACWLVCQAGTLTLVPVLLEASAATCVCPLGADATCPMHHKSAGGSKVCALQSTTTSEPATLQALFSVAGLLPTPPRPVVPVVTAVSAVGFERSIPTERPSPPDPPPPRA